MSKKKPTPPLPLTGVITITTDGRSTLAMKATHRGEDIEVSTGMANCRPGDVYSEYEGARIALARLYGLDPFQECVGKDDAPQEKGHWEPATQEKGHWEPATQENCGVGSRVKVVSAELTAGMYHNGQKGRVHSYASARCSTVHVIFDGNEDYTRPCCCLSELEVWVPDAPEEAKPQEAPIHEAPKPFTPSFRVGDIVRLGEGENVLHPDLRGKFGKVYEVRETPDLWGAHYSIVLNDGSWGIIRQYCSERLDHPAPLELVYRDSEKGGEKA